MRSLHLVTIEDLIERLSLEAGLVRAIRFKTRKLTLWVPCDALASFLNR